MVSTQVLRASEDWQYDRFGSAMAIHGNIAAITSDGGSDSLSRIFLPAIFLFERDPGSGQWREIQKLEIPNTSSFQFIRQLKMSDRFLVAKDIRRHEVFVYGRADDGTWSLQSTLAAADQRGATDSFGADIALARNHLFIGDPKARIDASRGAVFSYLFDGETWQPGVPVLPPDPETQRWDFGLSLAARDRWLFVGAGIDSTGAFTGTTGHLFEIDPAGNQTPFIHPSPVTQAVSGRPFELLIEAEDPDGNQGLVMEMTHLPHWMEFSDLGGGVARLTGTPTGQPSGYEDLQFKVTDPDGATSYDAFRLTLLPPTDLPELTVEPEDLFLTDGQDLLLRSRVEGVGPFSWQWFHNDEPIPGASRPTLEIAEATHEDGGEYRAEVRNVQGRKSSRTANVIVETAGRNGGHWSTTGSSMRRSGFHPARLKRHTFVPTWSRRLPVISPTAAAITDDKVFVSGGDLNLSGSRLVALDLSDGELAWSNGFGEGTAVSPPSIHRDRVYFETREQNNSTLRTFAIEDGTLFWEQSWFSRRSPVGAPAVNDQGIWIGDGYENRLFGFDLDGSPRFSEGASDQVERWAPILSGDRIFSAIDGTLRERDPRTGKLLWSNLSDAPAISAATIRNSQAFMGTILSLSAIDLIEQEEQWLLPETPLASFALAGDRLYGVFDDRVLSFDTDNGTPGPIFVSPNGEDIERTPPLLLHDHLIVSTENDTLIFDLETTELLQVIQGSGKLSYAGGNLIIIGSDGRAHAYFANGAPEFSSNIPAQIDSGEAAPNLNLGLARFVSDPDLEDSLSWAVVSISNASLFRTLEIDPASGELNVIYNPWQSGASEVTLSVTDPAGNVTSTTMTFTVPPHPAPGLELAESFDLNRRTGLYEHTITVTNSALREIAGFDLAISKLPEGARVYGSSPTVDGVATLGQRRVLAAGESVTLNFSYYLPIRGTELAPDFAATIVTGPEETPVTDAPGLEIDRCLIVDDAVLIEFTTTVGRLYEVQYSSDNATWKVAPTRIRAGGNRVQWIDRGPPQTDSPPLDKSARFYRVRELPENE